MTYQPQYKFIPPLHSQRLTKFYDWFCSLGGLGKSFKKNIVQIVPIKDSDKILDVGCATGTLLQELKRLHPNIHATGIDPDEDSLRIAQSRVATYPQTYFLKGFAESLPFENDSVDIVFCTLTLHHMPDEMKRQSIFEMKRVLVPKGKLVIADFGPSGNWLQKKYLTFMEGEYIKGNFNGVVFKYLQEAGFSEISHVKRNFSSVEILTAIK